MCMLLLEGDLRSEAGRTLGDILLVLDALLVRRPRGSVVGHPYFADLAPVIFVRLPEFSHDALLGSPLAARGAVRFAMLMMAQYWKSS